MKDERRRGFSLGLVVRRVLGLMAGLMFIYAGAVKLIDPPRFASDINNYQIIPWSLGVLLAFYLPWLELLCGLALIFHRLLAGALAITTALMVVFIGATIAAKARGIDVACGCFGNASSNLTLTWHLTLDAGILATLIFLWVMRDRVPAAGQM
jgi:uncharacterized membrane protein YphA (DoxX/SURF4 family)